MQEPQWDVSCPVEKMNMLQFIEKTQDDKSNKWYYFDYKYMHEWFETKPEILSAVDWKYFGFDKDGKDSTLWIGSKGAHTNCHQDSYGCNLIAQLHGRFVYFFSFSFKMRIFISDLNLYFIANNGSFFHLIQVGY